MESYRLALQGEQDKSNLFRVHGALGDALMVSGQAVAAVREYQQALELAASEDLGVNPRSVMRYLAWLQATSDQEGARNAAAALPLARRLVEIDSQEKNRGSLPASLSVLAAACAEAGRFDQAVSVATRAIELAESTGQVQQALRFRRHLEFYRAARPYRQNGSEFAN